MKRNDMVEFGQNFVSLEMSLKGRTVEFTIIPTCQQSNESFLKCTCEKCINVQTCFYLELLSVAHEPNIEFVEKLNPPFVLRERVQYGFLEVTGGWGCGVVVGLEGARGKRTIMFDVVRCRNELPPTKGEACIGPHLRMNDSKTVGRRNCGVALFGVL